MCKLSNYEVAQQVLNGDWGNGAERREKLNAAGYKYEDVQSIVNALVYDTYVPETESKKQPEKKPLEIDYDINSNEGIIINIIV